MDKYNKTNVDNVDEKVEVDKEAFEKLQKIFGIYDGDTGFGTVAKSSRGIMCDSQNKFDIKFMKHQGPNYWGFFGGLFGTNEDSLKYVMYIRSCKDKDYKPNV
jgi:hypothetical protein